MTRHHDQQRPGLRSDNGAMTAEILVITPILAAMVFAVIQAALWGWAVVGVHAAADGAARDGAAYTATTADARVSALQRLHAYAGQLTDIHVTVTDTITTVTVTITARSSLLPLPVAATVTQPRERFTGG
jgi:hypothetical protein